MPLVELQCSCGCHQPCVVACWPALDCARHGQRHSHISTGPRCAYMVGVRVTARGGVLPTANRRCSKHASFGAQVALSQPCARGLLPWCRSWVAWVGFAGSHSRTVSTAWREGPCRTCVRTCATGAAASASPSGAAVSRKLFRIRAACHSRTSQPERTSRACSRPAKPPTTRASTARTVAACSHVSLTPHRSRRPLGGCGRGRRSSAAASGGGAGLCGGSGSAGGTVKRGGAVPEPEPAAVLRCMRLRFALPPPATDSAVDARPPVCVQVVRLSNGASAVSQHPCFLRALNAPVRSVSDGFHEVCGRVVLLAAVGVGRRGANTAASACTAWVAPPG